jgi:hypothetical protein
MHSQRKAQLQVTAADDLDAVLQLVRSNASRLKHPPSVTGCTFCIIQDQREVFAMLLSSKWTL